MWRRRQAVQLTVQRRLYGHHRRSFGIMGSHRHLLSSPSVRSIHGGVARSGASNLSSTNTSWPSIFSDVSHPSPRYGDFRLFSKRGGHHRPKIPRMKDLHSVEKVVTTAHEHLDLMSRRDVSAVWARIPQLMTKRSQKQHAGEEFSIEDMRIMIETIFDDTTDGIVDCRFREITETTLGMAKIVQILLRQRAGGRRGEDAYRIILRELLLEKDNRTANKELFQFIAEQSLGQLAQFDARCLSNLAYAYALIEYVPKFEDGRDLFDHIAMHSTEMKEEFKPQEVSNMVWAFATVKKRHDALFKAMGDQVIAHEHYLREFKPQDLSNTAWAYATAQVSHPQLFEKMATHIVQLDHLRGFKPQNLSNTVWAYATAGVNHPQLYEKIGKHIVKVDHLREFKPQEISNTVWAYATARVNHPQLFEKMATHIVQLDHLRGFKSQNLSNTVWAYATAGVNHPQLFEKMANHIVGLDNLHRLDPQAISNTVWAYAKAGVNHPHLFKKVAKHIIQLDHLRDFNSQNLSNTVWAYATAQVSHPKMFQQVAKAAIQRKDDFTPQEVANLLWSYATIIIDKQLFSSFAPIAAKLIDNYNEQDLSHVAWAYALADVDAPTLFNDRFIDKCLEKRDAFSVEDLRQLYQWHLWQTKEKSRTGLPEALQDRCYKAFISEEPTPSKLQDDVVGQLSFIGLDPKEEVLMDSGYRIDALVDVNGKTIGVEVDGPSHFISRSKSPLGSTILKRRQVPSIDEIGLVSVPYWEWDKLRKDKGKKQEYLRKLLNL